MLTNNQKKKREQLQRENKNKKENLQILVGKKKIELENINKLIGPENLNTLDKINQENLKINDKLIIEEKQLYSNIHLYENLNTIYKENLNSEKVILEKELERIKLKREEDNGININKVTNIIDKKQKLEQNMVETKKILENQFSLINNIKISNYKLRKESINELKNKKNYLKNKKNKLQKLENLIKENESTIILKNKEIRNIPDLKREKNNKYYEIVSEIDSIKEELSVIEKRIKHIVDSQEDNNQETNNTESLKILWTDKDKLTLRLDILKNIPEFNINNEYLKLDNLLDINKKDILTCKEQIVQLTILKKKEETKKYENKTDLNCDNINKINNYIKKLKLSIINANNELVNLEEEKEKILVSKTDYDKLLDKQMGNAENRLNIMTNRLQLGEKEQENELKNKIVEHREKITTFNNIKIKNENTLKEERNKLNSILSQFNITSSYYFDLINDIKNINQQINSLTV